MLLRRVERELAQVKGREEERRANECVLDLMHQPFSKTTRESLSHRDLSGEPVSPRKGSALGFLLHSPAGWEQPEGSVASAQTRWWISEHGSWGPRLITLPAHRDPRGAFLRSPQYPLRFLWLQPWIVLRNGILSCSHCSWLRPETIGASWCTAVVIGCPHAFMGTWTGLVQLEYTSEFCEDL